MIEVRLEIAGMSCAHCVAAVTQALEQVSGVEEARVSVGEARVVYDPSRARWEDLVLAVSRAGYEVEPAPA